MNLSVDNPQTVNQDYTVLSSGSFKRIVYYAVFTRLICSISTILIPICVHLSIPCIIDTQLTFRLATHTTQWNMNVPNAIISMGVLL